MISNFSTISDLDLRADSTDVHEEEETIFKMSNIVSSELSLLMKLDFLKYLVDTNPKGACWVDGCDLLLKGRKDIIMSYQIKIYEWLKDMSKVHVDVQETFEKGAIISPLLLKRINECLAKFYICAENCNDHMPESKHSCLNLMFKNNVDKINAYIRLCNSIKNNFSQKFIPFNEKTQKFLTVNMHSTLDKIIENYKDAVDILHEDSGIRLQSFGNNDALKNAFEEVECWTNSPKMEQIVFNRSISRRALSTYITGVEMECNVVIHTSYASSNKSDRVAVVSGIKVTIMFGNVADQSADVVVNSIHKNLMLDIGTISNAIYKRSGPLLQKTCFGKNVPHDYVLVTDAFDMPCKKIFHMCISNIKSPYKDMKQMILMCLKEANKKKGISSIAIPPIGFGFLAKYELELLHSFFDACLEYTKDKMIFLRDIRFVIIDKCTFEKFEAHMDKLIADESGPWTDT